MAHSRKERTGTAPGGRYLRRFTLQNVRTFRSPVTLDFCHPDGKVSQWTVILGENGTGKTTLLQYLAGLTVVPDEGAAVASANGEKSLPPFRPMFASREWLTWLAANIPRPWSKPAEVTAQLELTAVATSLAAARPEHAKVGDLGLKLSFGETPDGASQVTASYQIRKEVGFYSSLRLFAYGASRHVAGSASPYLSSDTFFQNGGGSPVRTIFHDDYPLISPEQWLLGLDHAASSGKGAMATAAKHALQSARRCLTGTLPNVVDLSIKPHGLLKGQSAMTLMCRTPYGEVPFGALSVGYRTMAAWLTDFVKRMHEAYPTMEEPDNGPAVVLIDEFDLHMHPAWQREAMVALGKEFPNTQFIITAHSPLIVQATQGNAKLIVLRRKRRPDGLEEVEVVDNPEFAAGWRVDQILESIYGMSPRMPEYSTLINRRTELLQKLKLTKTETKELADIEERIQAEAAPQESDASKWLFQKLQQALELTGNPRK
jgi:energy-coupling factor transporter ATP-binding protein EcfA2